VKMIWWSIATAIVARALATRSNLQRLLKDSRRAPLAAGMIAFTAFLAVRLGQRMPPTGDEPHYLLIAQSLLYDHDVRVANNYERGDYHTYYGGPLAPHLSRSGPDSAYPMHAPGLSAVIAAAFAIAGYRGVVVWPAALTAIGTALTWMAAYAITSRADAAWFGWAVVALTVQSSFWDPCISRPSCRRAPCRRRTDLGHGRGSVEPSVAVVDIAIGRFGSRCDAVATHAPDTAGFLSGIDSGAANCW